MSLSLMSGTFKRFYKQASAAQAEHGYALLLDSKALKTPAGKPLVVPSPSLAEAIVGEWTAQGEMVRPADMPLTQLAATGLDRVDPERQAILASLLAYAGTDLLCYRADFPPDLVERQQRDWQPLLDWAAETLSARLTVTVGVVAVRQPEAALAALAARLEGLELWPLTAVQTICAAAGSLILALGVVEGRLTGEQAFALSQLDETYQIEQWGEDEEATQRRAALKRDILAGERLLTLL